MKIVAWLVGIVLSLVIGVYVLAFTPIGNSLVKPMVQTKIDEATKLTTNLSTFSLSMSDFEILLELNSGNTIHLKGDYGLFSQAFDIVYDVKLEKLQTLKALTNADLKGSFRTDGTVKGDMALINVDGKSDVASSKTTYKVQLTDLNPTVILAKIDNADLATLLVLGGQKPYAAAKVNLDINFKNIKPHQLDGEISFITKDGKLNTPLMNKDFNLTIPNTDFVMNLDAQLKGDDVDYTYALNSNLAKITSGGKVIPTPLKTDIKYSVDVEELAILTPITGADVRGAFRLNGTVKGTKANMLVNGESDFAASDTVFTAVLKEFQASTLKATMKNLKLQKVLYMVKQPHYADGIFDLEIDMSNLKSGALKGTVVSNIKKGLLDSKYMTKAYEFKSPMPRTTFSLATKTMLSGDIADTQVNLKSSLADFDIKSAKVNLKDSSVVSDYVTTIPNLDKLFFATQRHMKGSFKANGTLKKAKDLDLTMHSNVANGKMDVKLHNDDLHADLKSLQTLPLLKMLIYPEIFKSSLNGVLNYNLAQQKGTFKGDLLDGKFMKNKTIDMVKTLARMDLYKQRFNGDVAANINKEHIVTSLNLASNTSHIKTKDTKLNSKTNQIHSKLDISANKHPLMITLTGDVNKPKIEVDAKGMLKEKTTQEVNRQVNKLFKKLF